MPAAPLSPETIKTSLCKKTDDRLFGKIVRALADVRVSEDSFFVNEVQGWPIPGVVGVPYCEVVVDGNRVCDAEPLHRILHVVEVPFPEELRRVYSDDNEPLARVFVVPCLDPRQCPLTIDSPISPEFEEHDLPTKLLELQGR